MDSSFATDIHPSEVAVSPISIAPLEALIEPDDWDLFQRGLARAGELLAGREIWNVNSTAVGGGVAEMLRSWVAYARGIGIDMRWMTIAGNPEFFEITKRLHNLMHGDPGDGGPLAAREREHYEAVTLANAQDLLPDVRPDDVVLFHDPQTAGLVPHIKQSGATVLWRCHIGPQQVNDCVDAAWEFIRPYVSVADACVFSRSAYAPPWCEQMLTAVIPPSIDVLAPKNQEMTTEQTLAILSHVGLIVDSPHGAPANFTHADGTPGRVNRMCEVRSTGPPPASDDPLVVQVSRWDRLKDPIGVMHGYASHTIDGIDSHLILAGPTVHAVVDDPESAEVLDEVEQAWRELPHAQRSRVHLACLPMIDVDENAAIVNALQRHATVVVQKSIEEGFGLTVAEAMWKSRPVVASAVGGIVDQVIDGVNGVLLDDPRDLERFGKKTLGLLKDPARADAMGRKAHEHIRANFLENRHTLQYLSLFERLIG